MPVYIEKMEIWSDVTIAGQMNKRTTEQGKIELLSQWTMDGWDKQFNDHLLSWELWVWLSAEKRMGSFLFNKAHFFNQGCIFRLTCSHRELIKDHVLTCAYVKIFWTVTSVWRKKDCSWLPLNKHAMNIWLGSLRIRAHLSERTGKHLHILHVFRTYSTCSHPGG